MASSEGATDVSTEGTKRTFKIAEIIEMAEMLVKEYGLERGAATDAIVRFNLGVGSTLGHGTLGPGDPYIIRLKAEVERALGAGQFGPDDGHSEATTTSHGRDLGAGSTAEAPKISITAPEDGHGAVGTTFNRRGLRAGSTFPAIPAIPDYERGVVANPFDGRYFVPGSRLRQRGSGAGTQLRQEINASVELDNDDDFTHSMTMLAAYAGVAVSAFFLGIYIGS